jgi:small conductance mechanosensitive channel
MWQGQIDPGLLEDACGATPSLVCRVVLERTESRGLAEAVDILFARPLKIAIVLVAAWIVIRVLGRVIARFVQSLARPLGTAGAGAVPIRTAARAETLGYVLRSVSAFAVWTIAALTVLGEVGINLGPLIAGAGIVGVALGFGAQSLVKDFLAGIFVIVEDQYGVGDMVKVDEGGNATVEGTVEAVSLRSTHIRSVEGTLWHVPNGTIVRVGNMSQQWARALLDVEVGYDADIALTEAVIKQAADELCRDAAWADDVLEEPEVLGVEDLGADGVKIRLVVKTQPAAQFRVLRELRSRIKVALDAAGVEIPFPQRTVWVRRDPGTIAEVGGDDLDAIADS